MGVNEDLCIFTNYSIMDIMNDIYSFYKFKNILDLNLKVGKKFTFSVYAWIGNVGV